MPLALGRGCNALGPGATISGPAGTAGGMGCGGGAGGGTTAAGLESTETIGTSSSDATRSQGESGATSGKCGPAASPELIERIQPSRAHPPEAMLATASIGKTDPKCCKQENSYVILTHGSWASLWQVKA